MLKAAGLLQRGDVTRAYAELRDLLAPNPKGNYTPHALLLMGDCSALWGRRDDAAGYYTRVFTEHPESPLASVAHRRLASLPTAPGEIEFPLVHF